MSLRGAQATKQSHKLQDYRALRARNERVNTIASFELVEEFRDRQSAIVNQQSQINIPILSPFRVDLIPNSKITRLLLS